jgi:tetratricopeptide (TPR) repeat protein
MEHLQTGGTTSLTPVTALQGMGGVGKTALAAKAVQMLRREGHFPGGVGVLLCQGMRDPREVLRQILSHFDPQRRLPENHLDLAGLTTLAHTLLDGQQALIVLDNIEPDWPIEQVVEVLRATGVTLLLTARQTLPQRAVAPTASYPVGLLPEEEAHTLFVSALGRPLTGPAEVTAVEEILTTLGRHTLAVKLAGAYAGSSRRDLETLAHTLSEDPLSLPGDDAVRQAERAVERVLTESVATLAAEQERQLFTCLAAFATPEMGRNAVLALVEALGVPEPEWSLEQLVRRALLEPSVLASLPVASDRERIKVHPLLWALTTRRFTQLVAQERQAEAKQAIATYYARYTLETDDLVLGVDEANIVGALEWAEQARKVELVADLCEGMQDSWRDRGQTTLSLRYLPWGIAAAERLAEQRQERDEFLRAARLALSYGQVLQFTGHVAQAEGLFRENLQLRQRLQDRGGAGAVFSALGQVARQRGQLEQAEGYFQQSLAIDREVQDRQGEGIVLNKLGQVARQRGLLEQAEGYFQQSLAIRHEVQDRQGEGVDLTWLAQLALDRGQLDQAEVYWQQALHIREEVQDLPGKGSDLSNLGQIAQLRGQLEQAEDYYQQSLAIRHEVQDRQGEGVVLADLGVIAEDQERWDEAEAFYRQGLAAAREAEDATTIASIALTLGRLLIEQQHNSDAGCALLGEAMRVYQMMGLESDAQETRELAERLGCGI